MKGRCLYCGREYESRYVWQKYCSRAFQRRAGRHKPDVIHNENGPVLREFDCRMCSDRVTVVDDKDKRTVFCCQSCERKYWKHAYLYRNRGRASNQGMSIGSLMMRERRMLEE